MAAFSGRGTANGSDDATKKGRGRNVIAFITDGAGLTQISSARYLNAYRKDPDRFPLNAAPDDTMFGLDRHKAHGTITTFPDDPDEFVTDSAAGATAFASGIKTYNGAIGGYRKDGEFVPVETVLEKAHDEGYAIGLVTTAELTHATPAAFASHVPERGMQEEIARQYVQETRPDVTLGGQRKDFTAEGREDGRDLIEEAQSNGYTYVETADELAAAKKAPLLGLFTEESHMDYYVDRQNKDGNTQPDLADMTTKAIELLEKRSRSGYGFFLMVEAGRVDHAGHANDPVLVSEELEAANVASHLIDYVEVPRSKPTFLVSTADHETGGLSLSRARWAVRRRVRRHRRPASEWRSANQPARRRRLSGRDPRRRPAVGWLRGPDRVGGRRTAERPSDDTRDHQRARSSWVDDERSHRNRRASIRARTDRRELRRGARQH